MGANLSYGATPWFWSNQFDIKLQTVGLSARHDECLVRGDPDSGRFSLIYLRANRVIALDCVNSVKDYVQGRALVEAGTQLDRALACDSSIPLKSAVRPDALD